MIIRNNKIIVDVPQNRLKYLAFNLFDLVMNKIEKVKKYFAFLILFFLFGVINASASTLVDVDNATTSLTGVPVAYSGYLVQSFAPDIAENINGLIIKTYQGSGGANTLSLTICEGYPTGTKSDIVNCTGTGKKLIATSTGTFNNFSPTENQFNFSPALISGFSYFVLSNNALGFIKGNSYDWGTLYKSYSNQSIFDDLSIDIYFKTLYDDNFNQLDNLTTELTTPANNAVLGSTTPVFKGRYRDINRQADNLVIQITNIDLNQVITKTYSLASTTVSTSTRKFGTILDDVAVYPNYTLTGRAKWTAWLASGTTKISTNTPENFFVTGSSTWQIGDLSFKAEDVCSADDYTTLMGMISCGFKTAFAWAFYPSQSSLDNIKNAGSGLKSSFPFNVYFNLTDTISSTIASTTLSTTGGIGIPMIDKNRHIYVANFITSSTLPNAIGQTNATLVRNTITWLIWLLLAFAIFYEFKNIK